MKFWTGESTTRLPAVETWIAAPGAPNTPEATPDPVAAAGVSVVDEMK